MGEMTLFQHLNDLCDDLRVTPADRWRAQSRPVRTMLLTWPMVASLVATVAGTSYLSSQCERTELTIPQEVLLGNVGSVKSIAFRPDGAMLSSIGFDGSILIWDLANHPATAFTPRGVGPVRCAAFSPDTGLLATCNLRSAVSIRDLDIDEPEALQHFPAATAGVTCVAFSPNGATLAAGQDDGKITLWDAKTGRKRSTLAGHKDFVVALAFASDGVTLASSGGGHQTRIWDVPAGRERFAITSRMNTYVALAFSPDGRLLVLGDQVTRVVRLWDMETRSEVAMLECPSGAVVGVSINSDGTTLAAADYGGSVTLWDLATLRMHAERLKHAGVRSLAFAPDDRVLATGGFDGTINLWTLPSWSHH
jgi:WD40 repeat protein